ncbi:MAG: NUDIX domain-containing protein [Syntrophomonadaceae bacterium]
MDLTEKTIDSRRIFDGRIIKVKVDTVSIPNGGQSTREIVEHRGAVAIVPIYADGDICMVRQYRKPAEAVLLEIPAGTLEENEEPLKCAQRELAEETGLKAQNWEKVLHFYSAPGFSTEVIHLYLAVGLTTGDTNPDADEFIQLEKIPLKTAYEMIFDGRIIDGKSIIGIQHAYHKFNHGSLTKGNID